MVLSYFDCIVTFLQIHFLLSNKTQAEEIVEFHFDGNGICTLYQLRSFNINR